MSRPLVALLLLRLDARPGCWCPIAELAAHLAVPEAAVSEQLQAMGNDRGLCLALTRDAAGHVLSARVEPARIH